MTREQIFKFICVLCLITWGAQIGVLVGVGDPASEEAIPFMIGIMFLPGIIGLFYTLRYKSIRRSVQLVPKNFVPLLLAIVIPVALALTMLFLLQVLEVGASEYFTFSNAEAHISSGPWILGVGAQSWIKFIANLVITMGLYSAITGLAALGEEYGWRGVLQNAMINEFGFARGIVFLGTVWALWHAPLILAGYNYPNTPVLGALILLPALLVAASFVMAWLTRWNQSLWPAVLLHGGINSVYDSMTTKVVITNSSPLTVPVIEIIVFAIMAGIAIILVNRGSVNQRSGLG